MRSTSFYRPCAVTVKAALMAESRREFDAVVVENDHGMVVLSGALPSEQLVREAGALAEVASGALVINHIIVSTSCH